MTSDFGSEEDHGFGGDLAEMAQSTPAGAAREDAEDLAAGARSVGVLRVKNRDFAVGLLWASIEDTSDAVAEAKAMATREGTESDFYVVHLSASPQFGLGSRSQGHRAKMPSLAANLADNKSGTWIACFAVADKFYLLAVQDDGVFPGTDMVYETEEAARIAFDRLHRGGEGWDSVIAPESFGVSGAKEIPISALLIGTPRFKLADVAGRSRLVYLLGLLLVAAGAAFVAFQYYQSWQEEELARKLAEMRRNAERPFNQKVEIPPMPWEGRPVGAAFLRRCVDEFGKLEGIEPAAWRPQSYICEGGEKAGQSNWVAVAIFEREERQVSSINWLKAAAVRVDPKLGVVPEGSAAERAKIGTGLGELPLIPIDIKPLPIGQVKPYLWSHFDEVFVHIAIPDGERNKFFSVANFNFRTQLPLVKDSKEAVSRVSGARDIAGILARVPGLAVSKVTYDPKSLNWSVEGKIYEQHIPQNAQPRRR